jgi:cysteinyl-tRNA synthetase, unknown class
MRSFLVWSGIFCGALLLGCPDAPEDRDYRADMRGFVQDLSAYAKASHADFLIVPQNGEALLSLSEDDASPPASDYLAAIDGLGREDVWYGYTNDDVATPESDRNEILPLLDLAETQGVEVLVTDYSSTPAFMDESYASNEARAYVSFAAQRRELDGLPTYPPSPHNAHDGDVTGLEEVQNFLYLINPGGFATRTAYLDALRASRHDLLIIDFFAGDGIALAAEEVASLKEKSGGGARLVIAYLSIGEAEDYRAYWDAAWNQEPPGWLDDENPDWPGNYAVRYWDAAWQGLIFGGAQAYLDQIMAAGFNGVYLDKIDSYEFYEGK